MSQATREKSRERRRRRADARAKRESHEVCRRMARARSNRSFLNNAERYGQQQAFPEVRQAATKQSLLDSMTSWQRTQAMKACGGNIGKLTLHQAMRFSVMPHWKMKLSVSEREQYIDMQMNLRYGKLVDMAEAEITVQESAP